MATKNSQIAENLHDRIDNREEMKNAVSVAHQVVKRELDEALKTARAGGETGLETIYQALRLLSGYVGTDLADLTTRAVHEGAMHQRRLTAIAGAKAVPDG
jgi:hypothetical protein